MKIITSRIKNWDFRKRVEEIHKRIVKISEQKNLEEETIEQVKEVLQITEYWLNHMGSGEKKLKAGVKKIINLW